MSIEPGKAWAVDLDEAAEREPVPGYKVKFVHTDNMTVAFWTVAPDRPLDEHSHQHEQVATCIEGEFELTVDGTVHHMTPGTVVVIPPNVPHSARSVTACRLIDVFHPVREDYR